MTTAARPDTHEARFVRYLTGLAERDDRAALAALRRGLGKPPAVAVEVHPYVLPWLGGVDARDEDRFYLVAALFAAHARADIERGPAPRNFGGSMARLRTDPSTGDERASVARRFAALLDARGEDLPEHLRHAVALLRAGGVPVDWAALLTDLRWWDDDRRRVQRAWARAFWASAGRAAEPAPEGGAAVEDPAAPAPTE